MSLSLNHPLVGLGTVTIGPSGAVLEVVEYDLTEALAGPSIHPPITLPQPNKN